ncbi:MAG: serine/threonine-protein kinase [Planctomycetota bacterium]
MEERTDDPQAEPGDERLDAALRQAFRASVPPSVLHALGENAGSAAPPLLRLGTPPAGKPDAAAPDKYELFEELGRGGLGVVRRGFDRDLGREVALKFLREPYVDHPEALRRFLEEAQVGGQLQHPGVVPVYEMGLNGERQPYLAMKLIEGRTLSELVPGGPSPASPRRLLDLFEAVCQTMAYAHAQGVVHRDLKPANVLVGAFGEVQVADWGLAKVLGSGGADGGESGGVTLLPSDEAGRSEAGQVLGTPAYMPPEQARGELDRLDARADVFSLGALLCELLTGAPPYSGNAVTACAQAALGQLDDAHARLDACEADAEIVALARDCLNPEPARRPADAGAVAERLRAHFESVDERTRVAQIEAAESRVKAAEERRARKLTLRLASAIVLTALVGGGAAAYGLNSALDANRDLDIALGQESQLRSDAEQARNRAQDERERADEQRRRAEAVNAILTDMLRSSDSREGGRDVRVVDLLDRTVETVLDDHLDQPDVAADALTTIGQTYRSLGLFEDARGVLEEAIDLRREVGEPLVLASTLNTLAVILRQSGKPDEAAELYDECLEIYRQHPDEDRGNYATVCFNIAEHRMREGRVDDAVPLYREALALHRELWPDDPMRLAIAGSGLGSALSAAGEPEAEELLREALANHRRAFGEPHPYLAVGLGSLADHLTMFPATYGEAEELYREAIDVAAEVFGEHHPSYGIYLNNLGGLLSADSRAEEAEPFLKRAMEIGRSAYPPGSIAPRNFEAAYGRVLVQLGRAEEAEPLLRSAYDGLRTALGEGDQYALRAMRILGACYRSLGRFEEAEELLLGGLVGVVGERELRVAYEELVGLYEDWGRPDEARRWAEKRDAMKLR